MISVIIPVFSEQNTINKTIEHIKEISENTPVEIIISDGHPDATTLKTIHDQTVVKVKSPKGRGRQLNAGALKAKGDTLLFLHADTRLSNGALKSIVHAFSDGNIHAGAFDLQIDNPSFIYRIIEKTASIRSRITRTPYGDQSIFVRKSTFIYLEGYENIPIMEDVSLMRKLKKQGFEIKILNLKSSTSARRWQKEGLIYTTFRNWLLITLYYAGVSPEKLSSFYKSHK